MIKGILHYELKGINGWSNCQLSKVDVSIVLEMNPRKRAFMIFNRKYPYTLGIEYELPKAFLHISPIIGSHSVELTQFISKRYETKEDMMTDYHNILKLQNKLKKFSGEKSAELLKEIEQAEQAETKK